MHDAFLLLLVAAVLVTIYRVTVEYDRALWLSTCIVALNWVANTTYVISTGETDATAMFFAADLVSLVLVWKVSEGHAIGQLLASSYVGQLLAHALHKIGMDDPYRYWQLLTLIGIGQLLLLAAWAVSRRDAAGDLQ